MIRKVFSTFLIAGICYSSYAQGGAAPSSYLRHSGGFSRSDIWMQQVNVEKSFVNTYYCTLGWNPGQEAGGYAGIQDHNEGHIAIFSLWQPSNGKPITSPFVGENAFVEPFGGEGTGMHVKANIGWEMNNWYNQVIRSWPVNDHTFYAYWIHDVTNNKWKHIVTMDFPMPNLSFNNNPYSFIEDWVTSGQAQRKVKYRQTWVRNTSNKSWKHLFQASFKANDEPRNGIYNESFDAGTEDGAFFMEIGGNTTHAFPGHTTSLSVSSLGVNPTLSIGDFSDFQFQYKKSTKTLVANWKQDQSKSPQFSYRLELFDNPDYQGTAVKIFENIIPHAKDFNLDLSSLNDQKYYLRFSTIDIFDQKSKYFTSSFEKTNAPTIVITSPENKSLLVPDNSLEVKVNTGDAKTSVSKVEYFVNSNLIGSVTKAPFNFIWAKVYSGEYDIVARATNKEDVSSDSDPVHISVHPLCNSYEAYTGSTPAYGNSQNTFDKVLDGNVDTYFDYSKPNGGFVRLDYGANKKLFVNQIKYHPRKGRGDRMKGGKFQASNDANFITGIETLYTVTEAPANKWTTVNITPTEGYRYYRYLSPDGGYCNIAEMSLCGDYELTPPTSHFDCNGVLSGTAAVDGCGICAGGNTGIEPESQCTLGSANVTNVNSFKIYPNPNKGILFVETQKVQKVEVVVANLNGQVLLRKNNVSTQELKSGISISSFPTGLYFVSIKTKDNQIYSYKVIKN